MLCMNNCPPPVSHGVRIPFPLYLTSHPELSLWRSNRVSRGQTGCPEDDWLLHNTENYSADTRVRQTNDMIQFFLSQCFIDSFFLFLFVRSNFKYVRLLTVAGGSTQLAVTYLCTTAWVWSKAWSSFIPRAWARG